MTISRRCRPNWIANGVQCLFPERRARAFGKLWICIGAVRRYRADVIFAHATIPAFYARALPLRVPVVYVMHSATNDFERLDVPARRTYAVAARAGGDRGVAEQNIDDYVQAVGPHPSMTLVPNGVDMARFAFTDGAGSRTMAAPQIVQIGRYTSVKNQLLDGACVQRSARADADARLLLYGVIEDPAYQRAVVALAKAGHRGARRVRGPRSDVADLLSESSVFAMPSRSEGHSIAFLEALASGVPVVASTIPAFAFAADFPASQLVDTDNVECYAEAVIVALGQTRAQRSLAGLTLRDTADRYRAIARQVCPAVSAR